MAQLLMWRRIDDFGAETGSPALAKFNIERDNPGRNARRISSTRPHSGTRCSRCAFIRVAGIVHLIAPRANSSHVASRTSADRAAVSTWNSKASFARSHPRDAWRAAIAAETDQR